MIKALDPFFLFRNKSNKLEIPTQERDLYANWTPLGSLGEGSSGDVYLYRKGKKRVAVKVFPVNEWTSRKAAKENFDQEVLGFQTANLHNEGHPNVVKFLSAFVNGVGFYCIGLEYCKAGDLSGIYESKRNYTEADIRDIILQCSSGLDYLFKRFIVHRDIKEKNILVKQWKPIKVCLADLNFSRKIEDRDHSTEMSTRLGTPGYRAPEVLKIWLRNENGKYNHKIDIYSLGIVAYNLFTLNGTRPKIKYPEDIEEQRKEIRSRYHGLKSIEEFELLKKFYATFNDIGMPLRPANKFKNMSDEARFVVSRMLLQHYKARIDYNSILASDWSQKKYQSKSPSIRSYIESLVQTSDI